MKHFVVLRDHRPADIAMTEPLSLGLGQEFEIERMNRAIDSTADLQTLQGLAKQLLAHLANDWDADDDEESEAQPLAVPVAAAVAGAGGL
jgi:hypothetical protein